MVSDIVFVLSSPGGFVFCAVLSTKWVLLFVAAHKITGFTTEFQNLQTEFQNLQKPIFFEHDVRRFRFFCIFAAEMEEKHLYIIGRTRGQV